MALRTGGRAAGMSLAAAVFCGLLAHAGEADVEAVSARQIDETTWRFDVTVRHADDGWDHYADLWVVETEDGTRLGERVLAHPHVNEYPFTRSAQITVPADVDTVVVRAHDLVHGFGGAEMTVALERKEAAE